jgi:DNA-binding Xre family transcriptional regulator
MQITRTQGRPREEAPPGYVTVRQAADVLGRSTQAVRNGVREGRIPGKEFRREGTGELRYCVHESALVDRATADEIPMSDRDAALAAKDETIAELRQRVASLEQHLEKLESLLTAAWERSVDRPAPLDENTRESPQKPPDAASEISEEYEEMMTERPRIDGRRLKRLREARRMTQDDLAKQTGLHYGTVNRIERGKTPHVLRSTMLRLAEALDVQPDELLVKR